MNLSQGVRMGNEGRSGFEIAFHYDEATVESLKRLVPHTDREWRPESKTWWVSGEYEAQLKHLFPNFEALIYLQGKLWG